MTEKALEKLFVRKVQEHGGLAYKFVSPGNAGVPDRIVITPDGEVWFVELKTATGRLSMLQHYQIFRLTNYGCNVLVLRGKKGLEKCIGTIFNGTEGGDAE